MTTLSRNELSVLTLVASDASYRWKVGTPKLPTLSDGSVDPAVLQSWPDSSPQSEFGFPASLL
jgi:hypothetical protein